MEYLYILLASKSVVVVFFWPNNNMNLILTNLVQWWYRQSFSKHYLAFNADKIFWPGKLQASRSKFCSWVQNPLMYGDYQFHYGWSWNQNLEINFQLGANGHAKENPLLITHLKSYCLNLRDEVGLNPIKFWRHFHEPCWIIIFKYLIRWLDTNGGVEMWYM